MTAIDNIQVRAYNTLDSAGVVDLFSAVHTDVPSFLPTSTESWLHFTTASFNRGAVDFAVATRGERLVGLLCSTLLYDEPPLRHFRIVVHPNEKRQGLGRRLFNEVEHQAAPIGTILQSNCKASWIAGIRFLEALGFSATRRLLEMRLNSDIIPELVRLPEDCTLRDLREEDVSEWARLHEIAYDRAVDYTPLSAEDIQGHRAEKCFEMVVLEKASDVIGYCHVCDLQGTGRGLVNSVVVHPQWQGLGLSKHLLGAGIKRLKNRGLAPVELTVEAENIAAIRLYVSFGFEMQDEILTYRRPVA